MENLVTTYKLPKDHFSEVFCIIKTLLTAIFKSSLQNLSPLSTSLKVEPLAKPLISLKFFVNTTKPKIKVLAVFGQKLETKVSTLSLSSG